MANDKFIIIEDIILFKSNESEALGQHTHTQTRARMRTYSQLEGFVRGAAVDPK